MSLYSHFSIISPLGIYIIFLMIAIITNKLYRREERLLSQQQRYLTCGVDQTIPLELQIFMWDCVERLPAPKDYLQVFDLKPVGVLQSITHSSEVPAYKMEYIIPMENPIAEKVYVIDDGDHSTMLLANEY